MKDKGPGPEKQKRIQEYFEKKAKVQLHMDQGLGENRKNMGATLSSPLLGVHGSPALRTPSKEGRGPRPEERGGGEVEVKEKGSSGPGEVVRPPKTQG